MESYGTLRLANNEKIEGQWSSNRLVDLAIHTESNGSRYEEFYRDGISEGTRKPLKRKGEEMEQLLKSTSKPNWIPDNEAAACYHCDVPFTLFNRVKYLSFNASFIFLLTKNHRDTTAAIVVKYFVMNVHKTKLLFQD